MFSDWNYFVLSLVLLAANAAAWTGGFYRLPSNSVILCNCILFTEYFSRRTQGPGIGLGTIVVLGLLGLVGESIAYVARQRRQLASRQQISSLQGTLIGAGLGGGMGAVLGMFVPLVGPFVTVIGAVAGASTGASLGTATQARWWTPIEELSAEQSLRREQLNRLIEVAARQTAGLLMILTATSASLLD